MMYTKLFPLFAVLVTAELALATECMDTWGPKRCEKMTGKGYCVPVNECPSSKTFRCSKTRKFCASSCETCPSSDGSAASCEGDSRCQVGGEGASLAYADLSNCDFTDAGTKIAVLYLADLSSAILVGADLDGADAQGANLADANLDGASLRETFLIYANLDGATLVGADLTLAHLSVASLVGADFTDANLCGGSLMGADLTNAIFVGANLSTACSTSSYNILSGAILDGADFTGAFGRRLHRRRRRLHRCHRRRLRCWVETARIVW